VEIFISGERVTIMIKMEGGILAIVSHPDDETFGCGGTLALQALKGSKADVLCLTCNPSERKIEFINATKVLGISEPILFEKNNIIFDQRLINRISDIIVSVRPRIVITHVAFDYHMEHRTTNKLVKEAIEWAAHTTTYKKPCLVERLLEMEVNTLIPRPHIFVNISDVIKNKGKAIEHYKSQLAKFPWNFYQEFNLKKAELRGVQAKCDHAEAFLEAPLSRTSPFYEKKAIERL
jgi:LmbE family N-acetylglucosaminyl deacetylase